MNDTIPLQLRPEVEQFVAGVRRHFTDLPPEEAEDLLSGFEADIADQVAHDGLASLGDPEAYARELRAAAGLPAYAPQRGRSDLSVTSLLDAAAARWTRFLDALPADLGAIVRAARPAWWVLRAWVAVMVVGTSIWGPFDQDVPFLPTPSAGLGAALLVAASIGSIQLGRGRFWPGTRGPVARVVLLGLNAFAIVMTPQVVQGIGYTAQTQYQLSSSPVSSQGPLVAPTIGEVCNLQPYDASGKPLYGVQLFTESGEPLDVDCPWEQQAPWLLGDVARNNVFPRAEKVGAGERRFATLHRDQVPAVTAPKGVKLPDAVAPGAKRAAKKAQKRAQKQVQKQAQRQQP